MDNIVLSENDKIKLQKIELEALLEIDRICKKHDIKYILAYGTLLGAVRHKGFIPWDDDVDICMLRNDYNRFKEVCASELNDKNFYQSNDTDKEYFHLFNKIRVNDTVFKETFLSEYNIHHGVYIDIFPVDNMADNCVKQKTQYFSFYFYRTGLMAKYLNMNARHGTKKFLMRIFRIMFLAVPVKRLYNKSIKIATKYFQKDTQKVHYFGSAYKSRDIFDRNMYSDIIEMEFEGYKFPVPKRYDEMLKSIYGDYMQLPPEDKRVTRHGLTEFKF